MYNNKLTVFCSIHAKLLKYKYQTDLQDPFQMTLMYNIEIVINVVLHIIFIIISVLNKVCEN